MKPRAASFRFGHAALMQLVFALCAAAVWFYFRTVEYLSGPPDPDLYAWSWGFQIMVFALIYVPMVVGAWLAVMLLELGLLRLSSLFRAALRH